MSDDSFEPYLRKQTFRGKEVLITGHTGFKGSWLAFLLSRAGARVTGVSDSVPQDRRHSYHALGIESLVEQGSSASLDVASFESVAELVRAKKYDFIFHLAAQALVSESYEEPLLTFNTNTVGTLNLLEAARRYSPESTIVVITSDKAYKNDGRLSAYREEDRLGGDDPYSASKAAAEIIVAGYFSSFGQTYTGGIVSARAGNVFGGGDWSLNRLFPDLIRHLSSGADIALRKPNSTRPWSHVVDVIGGYCLLAQCLERDISLSGTSWNFASGSNLTTWQLAHKVVDFWPHGRVEIGVDSKENYYEADFLQIDSTLARTKLNWCPSLPIEESIEASVRWYANQFAKTTILESSEQLVDRVFVD